MTGGALRPRQGVRVHAAVGAVRDAPLSECLQAQLDVGAARLAGSRPEGVPLLEQGCEVGAERCAAHVRRASQQMGQSRVRPELRRPASSTRQPGALIDQAEPREQAGRLGPMGGRRGVEPRERARVGHAPAQQVEGERCQVS